LDFVSSSTLNIFVDLLTIADVRSDALSIGITLVIVAMTPFLRCRRGSESDQGGHPQVRQRQSDNLAVLRSDSVDERQASASGHGRRPGAVSRATVAAAPARSASVLSLARRRRHRRGTAWSSGGDQLILAGTMALGR
jgi:hypothetical protein